MTMIAAGEKRALPRVEGPSADGPAPELIEAGFGWEIADAGVLHHGLNIADFAHILDLHHRAIISDDVARELLSVLLEAHRRDASDFPYDPHHGEAYNSRERFFAERIGDCAGWLHAGRPRREAARVAFRIVLRRLTAELLKSGASFAEAACAVADRHRESFMADQTYLQQAQPSTFGHYLLGFVPPALRDGERLLSALHAVNRSPGGAGCVNGSHLLADRGYLASLLGFEAVIEHTRDAMWQVDTFIDILSTGVSLLSNQSKLAEDLEIWSSQEFNYVDLAGPYTRSSVLMPQKRNPYALTIIRGGSGMLIGRLSGFLAVVKTPSARSDNLIFAYGELPRALDYAVKISNLSCGVVKTLTVNEDRLWKALEAGFSQATDLAEYVMVECGIDYRSAYRIVGQAVREASAAGRRGVDIDAEGIRRAAQQVAGLDLALDPDKLAAALDPRQIVASRSAQGGAAPAVVADMAARFAQIATELGSQAGTQLAHFDEVEQQLLQRVESLVNG